MQTKLFLESDVCLNFTRRAQAFIYVHEREIKSWMLLSVYDSKYNADLKVKHVASVYNPLIKADNGEYGAVEYFETESDALQYIGSFLN